MQTLTNHTTDNFLLLVSWTPWPEKDWNYTFRLPNLILPLLKLPFQVLISNFSKSIFRHNQPMVLFLEADVSGPSVHLKFKVTQGWRRPPTKLAIITELWLGAQVRQWTKNGRWSVTFKPNEAEFFQVFMNWQLLKFIGEKCDL